jgi:hypothetical protein
MSENRTVSILGGGWSAGAVDKSRLPGFVIAVNDAAVHAPKIDAAVSMDRLWAENRFGWLCDNHAPKTAWLRRSACKNIPTPNWVEVFENDHTSTDFAEDHGILNGTNSGFCALNLAYQLRPDRIFLFGFDMNRSPEGSPYWFPDYPWAKLGGATSGGKYKALASQFEAAARAFKNAGIEVLNASPASAIGVFEKIAPEEVLCVG